MPSPSDEILTPRWLCWRLPCPARGRAVVGPVVAVEDGATVQTVRCLTCGRHGHESAAQAAQTPAGTTTGRQGRLWH